MRLQLLSPLLLASSLASAQSTRFVDASAMPGGDGSSWALAFTDLQDALDAARVDPVITAVHVAAGTYRPDRGTLDVNLSFELVDGVELLGGFPIGGGTRDPATNATVLSGDLLGDDGPQGPSGEVPGSSENARHVVRAAMTGPGTRLDGFVVRAGVAAGTVDDDRTGAGVRLEGGVVELRECRIEQNLADIAGGGLAAHGCAASLVACTFTRNRAFDFGGGAALLGATPGLVEDCLFEENFGGSGVGLAIRPELHASLGAGSIVRGSVFRRNHGVLGANGGGGVYLAGGRSTVEACTFEDNLANGGGGVFVHETSAVITRCSFRGNDASGDGGGAISVATFTLLSGVPPTEISSCAMVGNNGAVIVVGLEATLLHCTLADNRLSVFSGPSWPAIFGQQASITVASSIVWGNEPLFGPSDETAHLTMNFGTTYQVVNSIVEDWSGVLGGTGFQADPRFEDPRGPDGDPATVADNVYRLRLGSAGLDRGSLAMLATSLDVEGHPRVADGNGDGLAVIDLGAYERAPGRPAVLRRAQHP